MDTPTAHYCDSRCTALMCYREDPEDAKFKLLFECHITCHLADKSIAGEIAAAVKWKTSEIERDPVLGNAAYFYLTSYDDDLHRMKKRLVETVEKLVLAGCVPVRQKIEAIVFDTKTGVDLQVQNLFKRI